LSLTNVSYAFLVPFFNGYEYSGQAVRIHIHHLHTSNSTVSARVRTQLERGGGLPEWSVSQTPL
jgi:hypothetical protein